MLHWCGGAYDLGWVALRYFNALVKWLLHRRFDDVGSEG
jgi:hypothetical protein